jgi:hypothetical protein
MGIRPTNYIQSRSPTWRDLLISRSPIARWAPVPLRLIIGYGFMEHGFAKVARVRMRSPQFCSCLVCPHHGMAHDLR